MFVVLKRDWQSGKSGDGGGGGAGGGGGGWERGGDINIGVSLLINYVVIITIIMRGRRGSIIIGIIRIIHIPVPLYIPPFTAYCVGGGEDFHPTCPSLQELPLPLRQPGLQSIWT